MKTNTIYIFIFSFLLVLVAIGASIYASIQIKEKTEAVKVHYAKGFKSKSSDLGLGLKKELNIILEHEKIITQSFLNQNEIIPFITNLESLASTTKVALTVDKVDRGAEESVGQTYKTQTIAFTVLLDGSFEQIKAFMNQAVLSKKIIEISEFKIYKTENSNMYNARIIIKSNILSL